MPTQMELEALMDRLTMAFMRTDFFTVCAGFIVIGFCFLMLVLLVMEHRMARIQKHLKRLERLHENAWEALAVLLPPAAAALEQKAAEKKLDAGARVGDLVEIRSPARGEALSR